MTEITYESVALDMELPPVVRSVDQRFITKNAHRFFRLQPHSYRSGVGERGEPAGERHNDRPWHVYFFLYGLCGDKLVLFQRRIHRRVGKQVYRTGEAGRHHYLSGDCCRKTSAEKQPELCRCRTFRREPKWREGGPGQGQSFIVMAFISIFTISGTHAGYGKSRTEMGFDHNIPICNVLL